jgi:hypothetical protein
VSGGKSAAAAAVEALMVTFCPECGQPAEAGNFCVRCGGLLSPAEATATGVQDGRTKPKWTSDSASEPATAREQHNAWALWWGRLTRACSIRVGCVALLFGVVMGALAGWLWEPMTGPVALISIAIFWLAAVFNDEQALNCPRCRKMVKVKCRLNLTQSG